MTFKLIHLIWLRGLRASFAAFGLEIAFADLHLFVALKREMQDVQD